MKLRPLEGLVLALLPAAVAFAEVIRGTHSTGPWHPLGVIAFVWMLGAVAWWCWREFLSAGGMGALARGSSSEQLPSSTEQKEHLVEGTAVPSSATGEGAHATGRCLLSLSLFMLFTLGIHPVLFALLNGGWGSPIILKVDPDLLYYAMDLGLWIVVFLILMMIGTGARRVPTNDGDGLSPLPLDFNLRFNFRLADIPIFAFFAVVTFFVLRLYLQKLGHTHAPMHIFGVTKASDPAVFYAVGALFTLINALAEELWFRGLLLGALRGLLPMWPAVLLQALCFGLSHWVGTPQGILGLVLAGAWGIALGWWAYTRGSIWQPLLVHLLADWLIFAYTNG